MWCNALTLVTVGMTVVFLAPSDHGEAADAPKSDLPPRTRDLPPHVDSPNIPGLSITRGETVFLRFDATYPSAFRFSDGRIAVSAGDKNHWSTDGGRTWSEGPPGPGVFTVELGGGEVLSLGSGTTKCPDGRYRLPQRRSFDRWKTVTEEKAIVDIPRSVPQRNDEGKEAPGGGFVFDHGIIRLKDGRLAATASGLYEGDTSLPPKEIFPAEWKCYRPRVVVVFSSDKGKTWRDPVTLAYSEDPKVAMEGFSEAALARARNGDILCIIRSGGRHIYYTGLYLTRSKDEGKTWSAPAAITDRGVWPNLCVMDNGVIVCAYGRPDNLLVFSTDDGNTWTRPYRYHADFRENRGDYYSSNYSCVMQVGSDNILVIHDVCKLVNGKVVGVTLGTFFTVKKA
jgi:hypothetical protein